MKIYSKIMLITLPLILLPALLVGFLSYQLSRNALQTMLPAVLSPRLARALDICEEDEAVLREYGLEQVTANVVKAQTDAASALSKIRFGQTGYVWAVDAQGVIRAHPDPAFPGHDVSAEAWFQEIRRLGQGQLSYVWQGENRLAMFERFEPWGWYLISSSAESEITGVIDQLGMYTLLLLVVSLIVATAALLLLARWLTRPIAVLMAGIEQISRGEKDVRIPILSGDEIGVLARAVNAMAAQLQSLIDSLEQQVADRTRALQQRSAYLEAAVQVGRTAASLLEMEQLVHQVVDLVQERFGLYYVGLFLMDPTGQWVHLEAGTGRAGQAMLARGHRLKVGEGMVGWCVAHGQPRVTEEAGADAVHLATPELPETRSEAALPLRSRGQVLGALTVQHTEPRAFDSETLAVLQLVADQVAVALDNARLFAARQEALEAERRAYGEISLRAWQQLLLRQRLTGYGADERGTAPTVERLPPEVRQVIEQGPVVLDNNGLPPRLAVPVSVRDQLVAVLRFCKGKDAPWTQEEIDLAEDLAGRLGLALESARLYQDTQRRAARERLLGEITTRMRETLDVDMVLQTAIREMGEALNIAEVEVRLGAVNPDSPHPAAERGES